MNSKKSIDDNYLDQVNGGMSLPKNWKQLAIMYESTILQMFGDLTYQQACAKIDEYFESDTDRKILKEYIKKYYPEFQQQQ